MRCPTLSELPPPPPGRTGWPWTEESPRLPEGAWPRISIVTPSYMQAAFIEHTIRSVLLQGYPDVEYFVLDAGSTDATRDIIRRYEPWLAGWRSERDRGQSAAVNEGWAKATGDLQAWINSDDWYQPGAFAAIARAAVSKPAATWFAGHVDDHAANGAFIKKHPPRHMPLDELLGRHDYGFHQPGMFWRRDHLRVIGPLDESLHNSFDCDLWARSVAAGHVLECIDAPVACFRRHRLSKTGGNATRMLAEDRIVWSRHAGRLDPAARRRAERWLRAYEADRLLMSVYQLLAAGRRGKALGQLIRQVHLIPYLRPATLYFGALTRVLFFGKPAPWFLAKTR
jgi:glycosyltransferase involved in cell wall biosynthesis